ncbi:hypothetical protein [Lactobacillus sp. ESL0230]|uniref:hypothetical protein n=1 Tax=Lactobacillus sp. ESL0230 TaxID=2069353 RepID=UPI000EFCE1FE|nr:hypothetical protein [Lactobacillus sp. ESL0230]RMC46129.1 hypothetical protein F5ESL0230_02415 [Lactobacillus sp. ESL0230]
MAELAIPAKELIERVMKSNNSNFFKTQFLILHKLSYSSLLQYFPKTFKMPVIPDPKSVPTACN